MLRFPLTCIFLRGLDLDNEGFIGRAVALCGPYLTSRSGAEAMRQYCLLHLVQVFTGRWLHREESRLVALALWTDRS